MRVDHQIPGDSLSIVSCCLLATGKAGISTQILKVAYIKLTYPSKYQHTQEYKILEIKPFTSLGIDPENWNWVLLPQEVYDGQQC